VSDAACSGLVIVVFAHRLGPVLHALHAALTADIGLCVLRADTRPQLVAVRALQALANKQTQAKTGQDKQVSKRAKARGAQQGAGALAVCT